MNNLQVIECAHQSTQSSPVNRPVIPRGYWELVPMRFSPGQPPRYISKEVAEIMVLRGTAVWSADGTRRLFERAARIQHSESRHWAKTRCYDPDTRVSIHTMQLVPGPALSYDTTKHVPDKKPTKSGRRKL